MQKLYYLCFLFVFSGTRLFAQGYTLDYYQQPYTPLQGDSSISEGIPWFNETWDIPIGFNFKFLGQPYDSFVLWNEALYFDFEQENLFFSPYTADLNDKGWVTPGPDILSPISILRDGTPGNRILKIQVKNAGFFEGGAQDSVNFQTWIYEGSNVIEVHFGPRNIVSNVWQEDWSGPIIGAFDLLTDYYYLAGGNPAMPEGIFYLPEDSTVYSLNGPPPSGIVYRFTPTTVASHEVEANALDVEISPNPFLHSIRIHSNQDQDELDIQVYDLSGHPLLHEKTTNNSLNLSNLPAGAYFLKVKSRDGTQLTRKIIKSE
jgi:hypothetical protein